MAKYSPTGARLWTHPLGSTGEDQAFGAAVDGSGNSYIAGYTYGRLPGAPETNAGSSDVFVARFP